MYFKKLELVGFKSFMDKTTLHFEPGVTAVVGPNGCGKSNIFDSIRWVLGEQSVKSLRGSQMEDVIFNGTDAKQPLSMAEVSLTFDNENKFFPVDHNEVVVTRRIFRSGESEYLLNKSPVRLKDILDLLMGTGIGAESYSLVAQGKIDLILSSKPEDRRLVFDEASGITKYKAQKREALKKLEETQQNLLRAGDIIAEVKRSIGYLERQANKARKYKDAFELLKTKEMLLAVIQKNNLKTQKDEIVSRLQNLRFQEEELQNKIKGYEAGIEQYNQELKSREEAIAAIKDNIVRLENESTRDIQHIHFNQERSKELENASVYLTAQIQQTQDRLSHDEEKLRALKEEETTLKQSIEEKSLLLRDTERQLNDIVNATKTAVDAIALAKRSILDLAAKVSQAKNEIVEANSKQHVFLARKKRLELENAKTHEERIVIEDNLQSLDVELKQMHEALTSLNSRLAELNSTCEHEQSALNQLNQDIEVQERQKLALVSHKEFLEKLKTQYESIDTSMNAVIYLDKLPGEKISGLVVKVGNYLELKDEEKSSYGGVNLKLAGEAKPIDLDAQRVTDKINQIEEKLVALKAEKLTREGRIQELNQTLQVLKKQCQEQEIILSNKNTSYQSVLEQCNKAKEEEQIISVELGDVQQEMAALEGQLASLQNQAVVLEQENKAQEMLIHSEQEKIAANSNQKEEILVAIAKTKAELESQSARLNSEDTTLALLEDSCKLLTENIAKLNSQIQDSKVKRQALDVESSMLSERVQKADSDKLLQSEQLKTEEGKYQELSAGVHEKIKFIEEERSGLDVLKERVYTLQMDEKDLDFKYQSIKERIAQVYKIDLDAHLQQDVALQEPEGGKNVSELITGVADENALTQEIEALKEKVNSYGTVNLVAIEEYDELKKRYDFLTQQQADLLTAKESVQEAIQKINRTTRKMFVETFEKVAEEFRNYFRLLFNGGDAKVYLLDEQDPLESGIEIICRPPGKKLQNVLLLSGGEKSMSAIALIFAIFKVKPAPFCVLDEIDAALDEANVDRFSRLFQEFTKTSQFIVITHNKRTIANANVMYGITMVESGVSRIVSVKFAERPKQELPQPAGEPVAA